MSKHMPGPIAIGTKVYAVVTYRHNKPYIVIDYIEKAHIEEGWTGYILKMSEYGTHHHKRIFRTQKEAEAYIKKNWEVNK